MNNQLQWEIDWINSHPEGYDGPMHQKAVIGNITKRYNANETKRLIKQFKDTKTTAAYLELFEH